MENLLFSLGIEGTNLHPTYCGLPETSAISNNTYQIKKCPHIEVKCVAEEFEHTSSKRQRNTVKNNGESTEYINLISSGSVALPAGELPWYHKDKYRVHFCQSSWQGEGQWSCANLDQLGITEVGSIRTWRAAEFSSIGSWSTNQYYPLIYVEDLENGKTWFFEMESSASWQITLCIDYVDGADRLLVSMNSASIWNDGWCKTLKPGESYTTESCVWGCADGDINDAVRELIKYKRQISLTPAGLPAPLVFNDYMGCLWALPTDKKLIPVIDKAAELGAEYFCIDAGWFLSADHEESIKLGQGNGLWYQYDPLFGELGFDGIIDYIKSKGMKPGIWLEIETFEMHVRNEKLDKSCILTRNGGNIEAPRTFLDMRNQKVRDYLMSVFDYLYKKGIRFIKNDYNRNIGAGCDCEEGNFSLGLLEHSHAVYSFFDEVRAKYPDILIENCGSGAQRADGEIMRHFNMMSTSDQMEYYKNPSIISGTLLCQLPEKAEVWTYPYSIPYLKRDMNYQDYFTEEWIAARTDGEETVCNMVTAMLGTMYMSGHPDYCDEYNFALYKEGAALWKELRDFICKAYPIYPTGTFRMVDEGIFTCGLTNEEGSEILLAVWRIGGENSTAAIDLSKWVKNGMECRQIYPEKGFDIPYCYDSQKGILTVKMEKPNTARLFKIG